MQIVAGIWVMAGLHFSVQSNQRTCAYARGSWPAGVYSPLSMTKAPGYIVPNRVALSSRAPVELVNFPDELVFTLIELRKWN